jgi:anti-anti-sigma factor
MPHNLHFEHKNGMCKITIPEHIGLNNIIQIQGRIELELGSRAPDTVLVDLSRITYLSSTTITLLMHLRDIVYGRGGILYIVNVNPLSRERLELIHLDKVFLLYENEQDIPPLSGKDVI